MRFDCMLIAVSIVLCGAARTGRAACMPACDVHATCVNNTACVCNQGYMGNGLTCTPINACLQNPCDVHATCTKTGPGTFTCMCNPGFTGDGKVCMPAPDLLIGNDLTIADLASAPKDLAAPATDADNEGQGAGTPGGCDVGGRSA